MDVRERFWGSAAWPLWKQLAVAAAVIGAVAVALSPLAQRGSSAGTPATVTTTTTVATTTTVTNTTTNTTTVTTDVPTTAPAPPTVRPQGTLPPTTAIPTTATPTTATPPTPTGNAALALLQTVPVEREHQAGYNRDLFAVWSDLDGDGCDTRQEVLITESLVPADVGAGCDVISGHWYSAYDGVETNNPSDFDIDHLVALKEAWDSGAWNWSPARRIAYGNDLTDPRTLTAVSATSNRQKGDADPSNWLPSNENVCTYLADWVAVKVRWSLSMDQSEWGRINKLFKGPCAGVTIAPSPPVP